MFGQCGKRLVLQLLVSTISPVVVTCGDVSSVSSLQIPMFRSFPIVCDIYKICCMMFYVYMKCTYLELFGYTCIIFMYLFFGMSDSSPQHLTLSGSRATLAALLSVFSRVSREFQAGSFGLPYLALENVQWAAKHPEFHCRVSVNKCESHKSSCAIWGDYGSWRSLKIRFEVRCVCLKSAFFPVWRLKEPSSKFRKV